jgi:hypothetical protein
MVSRDPQSGERLLDDACRVWQKFDHLDGFLFLLARLITVRTKYVNGYSPKYSHLKVMYNGSQTKEPNRA